MSDEQKLVSFMRKYGEQEAVARHYLTTNNWTLELASIKYEADNAQQRSNHTLDDQEFHSLHSLESRNATKREDEPDAYFGGPSDSSIPGASSQQPKRVHMGSSTPALTPVDSEHSLHAWGHGVRLGSAHPFHPPPTRDHGEDTDSELEATERSIVVLNLWSEGFSVDNGSLRHYEVPENERFLRALMRGDFPDEMQILGKRIELNVRDRTNESYRELSRKQFMGFGRSLCSSEEICEDATQSSQQQEQQVQEQTAQLTLEVNEKSAITTIHFRLANGSRIVARFNTTHRISDLYSYVRLARPQYAKETFTLITAFPHLELQETDSRTLAEANLINVVVTQHINEEFVENELLTE